MASKKSNTAHTDFAKFNKELAASLSTGTKDIPAIDFKKMGEITEFIRTGNYLLNAQMSGSLFGGAPNARSLEIAGVSGSGKSFIAMNMAREAQKMGYYVYFIDTEGAQEESDFKRMGIDTENGFQHVRSIKMFYQVQKFMMQIIAMKEKYPDVKIIVFLDSYAHLLTNKEVEDAEKGKVAMDMGLRAKTGRAIFKSITLDLANLSIPFIFTNHTGKSPELYAGDKKQGGGGPTYAASVILMLKQNHMTEGEGVEKTRTGIIVRSTTDKNRLARPVEIKFHISLEKGMNPYTGLEKYASWENCGVARGRIMPLDEYEKKTKGKSKEAEKWRNYPHHTFEHDNKMFVAVEYQSKTWMVKDTVTNVPIDQYFTSYVFTEGTLKELDEKVIKPEFRYKDFEEACQEEALDLSSLIDGEEAPEEGDEPVMENPEDILKD